MNGDSNNTGGNDFSATPVVSRGGGKLMYAREHVLQKEHIMTSGVGDRCTGNSDVFKPGCGKHSVSCKVQDKKNRKSDRGQHTDAKHACSATRVNSYQNKYSFLHWNVNGLFSKISNNDFVDYVSSFDFICLVETFVEDFNNTLFDDHKEFVKPALKLSKDRGRRSGGVICLIRKTLLKFVEEVKTNADHVLMFMLNKTLFGLPNNVLYVCAYAPPEKSPYYSTFNVENGISQIEDCLTDAIRKYGNISILMCGDFNGRISNLYPDFKEEVDDFLWCNKYDLNEVIRHSKDNVVNCFGRNLLSMCTALGLYILNGVCDGDRTGCFTFIKDSGTSVNDYFMVSGDLFDFILSFCNMCVKERIESDHMPLEFCIDISDKNVCQNVQQHKNEFMERYIWKSNNAEDFSNKMNSHSTRLKLAEAIDHIPVNVNEALDMFNDIVKQAAECMKETVCMDRVKRHDKWFDQECRIARQNVRKLLRKFNKTLEPSDRYCYCTARREYKNMISMKKLAYNNQLYHQIESSIGDQKDFWKNVRTVLRKDYSKNTITTEEWYDHFKNLLDIHDSSGTDTQEECVAHVHDDSLEYLDRPISKQDVISAIKKLKNAKAAGPDGFIGEIYKGLENVAVDFLVNLFNNLFDSGVYPEQWTESVIVPLFKKGDKNNPNNYRGISLSNIASKLYSSIINNRLSEWIELNNITGEYQAGFKRGYSTIDHLFTLMAAVQKQFTHNRKLYVAFIDFEKAFDTISRKLLWPILSKNGINGKLHKCIKSMYDDVKAKIRCGAKFSDYIRCTQGVKQGDVCSPVLFSLFINELALEIINNGRHGANFQLIELFILLFADDIALISETAVGLQTQLNSLHSAASRLELRINMDKSNIVVFRKGGYLAAHEKWYYGNRKMSIVNAYKYLGLYVSTKLSFTFACQDLVSRGKRALLRIFQLLYKFENASVKLFLKLFDAQVQPIVQYGAEIWGFETGQEIEKLHLFALKRFLQVDRRTPNDLVYGELGRYPIYLNSYIKCIKYWLKLVCMNENRLPAVAYKTLRDLDNKGKITWVAKIRQCLCSYGFAFVWFEQGVGNVRSFLSCFRQRIIDCRWQEWDCHMQSSDRFSFFRLIKTSNLAEPYLLINMNRFIRGTLTKLRFGVSDLTVHKERYRPNVGNMICPLCKIEKEDEIHFVLCCPSLEDLRERYIPIKYYKQPLFFRLVLLLTSKNDSEISNLAMYLYKSFKRRSLYVDKQKKN